METGHCAVQLSHRNREDVLLCTLSVYQNKVDVRITDTMIEIFYNHKRIALHRGPWPKWSVFRGYGTYVAGSREMSGMERRLFSQMGRFDWN